MNTFNPLRDAIPTGEIRRALIIKLRHHGDVLLASPVFSVLKSYAPRAEIDALVYADTAEMLSLHPAIDQLHTIDRKWKGLSVLGQFSAEMALYKQLKERDYDLVIHLTEHWRGAWLCRLLQPRWSVGPLRKERGKVWRRSFTHLQAAPTNAFRHTVEINLDALRRIGIQPAKDERRLTLVPGSLAEKAVAEHLASFGLAGGDFILIHPASRWFFKCWPIENMAELISRLQLAGYPVVLTAAPSSDEQAMLTAIQSRLSQPAFSLAGQLSMKELAALLQAAKLFVGVDSAPMHIAAAVGTPVVALFGPSSDRQWGPWEVQSRIISSLQHPCRPCGIDGCGGGKLSACLTELGVDEVLAAAHELLTL